MNILFKHYDRCVGATTEINGLIKNLLLDGNEVCLVLRSYQNKSQYDELNSKNNLTITSKKDIDKNTIGRRFDYVISDGCEMFIDEMIQIVRRANNLYVYESGTSDVSIYNYLYCLLSGIPVELQQRKAFEFNKTSTHIQEYMKLPSIKKYIEDGATSYKTKDLIIKYLIKTMNQEGLGLDDNLQPTNGY